MSAPNLTGGRCPMHPLQGVPCTVCGTQVVGTGLLLRDPAVPVSALRALEATFRGRAQIFARHLDTSGSRADGLQLLARRNDLKAAADDLAALCDQAEEKP
jgi:hypothetical protein